MPYTSIDQFLEDLPRLAQEHRADLAGRSARLLFDFKQGRKVFVTLENGELTLAQEASAAPETTILADENDLLSMLAGRLSPMKAIMLGKVKIKGNPKPLMELIGLIR